MKTTRFTRTLLLCCSIGALTIPALARATEAEQPQGDASVASGTNAEIIVTATRQAQSLQDTPMAVDVVTASDVAKLSIFDAKEIQNLSPGLQLANNDGRSNIATLRGVTFDPDSGSSPAVEIFLNEVATDANTAFTAIYDIGQIEILRGPQGLFRGKTSPAGAILFGTQRASVDDFTGYVQGTATNRDGVNAQGAANLVLIPGKLGMRTAILYDQNRVSGVRRLNGEYSSSKTMSARTTLSFEDGPLSANLMYQYLNADTRPYIAAFGAGNAPSAALGDPTTTGPALTLEDRRSVTEGVFRFKNRTHFATFNASYDLGGARLVYNGGYQDSVLAQQRDQDTGNAVPNYTRPQILDVIYKTWSNELRLESAMGSRFSWAVAANYRRAHNIVPLTQVNDQLFALNFVGPIPPSLALFPIDVAVNIDILQKEYGLAGTVGYELFDGLKVTGGLRHTWTDIARNQTTDVTLPSFGVALPTTKDTSNLHKRAFTGGANLSWEITRDFTAYASYGHSFRPGVFAVGVTVPLATTYLNTKDEKSDGGEIGFKANFLDRKVSLNVAGFYQKFSNYLSYNPAVATDSNLDGTVDPSISPLPFAGNAVSKGVEVQFTARPTTNFDIGISAAYANSHYDNAPIICNDYNGDGRPDATGAPSVQPGRQVSECVSNDRLAQVPRFTMNGTSELRLPLTSVTPFLRGLVNYRPGFNSTNDNYQYRAYTKLDLFLGVRDNDGRWEITGFAKNMLNQTRALSVSQGNFQQATSELDFTFAPTGNAGLPFDSGYRTAAISAPREFGLTGTFRW